MDYAFISNQVSQKLITLLEQNNLSEYELSMRLGKCRSYINKIVSKKSIPSLQALTEICDYFDITCAEFFTDLHTASDPHTLYEIIDELKKMDTSTLQLLLSVARKLNENKEHKER